MTSNLTTRTESARPGKHARVELETEQALEQQQTQQPVGAMKRTDDRTEHQTYQYLRLAMMGALATLAVSLLIEYWQTGWCAQTSISAYYFTEVQAVFVGALLVLGVSMVVIQGRLVVEDAALNLAGLLAPIVAFAPTTEFNYCGAGTAAERAQQDRTIADVYTDGSVVNNVWAYLVVVAGALAISAVVLARTRPEKREATYWVTWSLAAGWLIAVGYAFFAERAWFEAHAHIVSAVTLFVFIFVAVAANAVDLADEDSGESPSTPTGGVALRTVKRFARFLRQLWHGKFNRYGIVTTAMLLGVLLIAAWKLVRGLDHWFLWIEIVLIALFAYFWVIQTFDRRARGHD